MDILYKILATVLIAIIPIVTGFLCDLIYRAAQNAKEKTEDARIARLIDEIGAGVRTAVSYVNQTFVDELKKSGVFGEDEEYAKDAFEQAFTKTIEIISEEAVLYIEDTFGDIREYLEAKIEEAVHDEKRW